MGWIEERMEIKKVVLLSIYNTSEEFCCKG